MLTSDLNTSVSILIAGSSAPAVEAIDTLIKGEALWRVTTLVTTNGQQLIDLLKAANAAQRPVAVVILACSDQDIGNLEALGTLDATLRPPVIVCGTLRSPETNRAAVRAGAADLLAELPEKVELIAALQRIVARPAMVAPKPAGSLITVLGASGGVGASFLAANLAHLSVAVWGRKTLLVDFDPVYVTLATALGLQPERGLQEALQNTGTLDTTAFEAYVTHHSSGLGLLACAEGLFTAPNIDSEQLPRLLEIALEAYDLVFVDGSRWLDNATTCALSLSKSIVIVTDQTVVQVRNAAKLYRILTQQMGLSAASIVVVINRYNENATVQPDMVKQAIGCDTAVLIPNMTKLALESMDTAVPVFELDRKSLLTRALIALGERLLEGAPARHQGLLSKAFSMISGGRS